MSVFSRPCSALLFDADGVLIDSDASVVSAWTQWATTWELDPQTVLSYVHGRRSSDTVAALVAPDNKELAQAQIDHFEVADAVAVRDLPGAAELLATIPRDSWAVVTSATRRLAMARFRAARLPLPDVFITADDVRHGKPDPAGYRAAARALGVATSETIVLEDAVLGVEAARAAGVIAVIGIGGRGLAEVADVVVPDLRNIRWEAGIVTVT